ncbi:hypothetical protein AAA799E16_01395 [Marine Group I thaumarchaeote SCGC AAA799-E16]|uniref:Uncharacterized protein n=2 Tax=Marine Group I TaxID=905826 RepID=A0A087RXV7_9ARCH|nr:hypothetical protein AAA799E16_01395 [Marine Group I thaumarchaeote SCGC AAA799-E16]KFM18311.1 hypothetical protein SCCGRSA3_01230 [Marine Group I thaumarchaeote SCGC RSA3]
MQWFGILALLFMISALGGVVYIGANTDKLGFDFGSPNAISSQFTAPSNNLPSFSIPSFQGFSSGGIDIDKMKSDLERKLMNAQSEQEINQIIEDSLREVISQPGLESECRQVMKEYESEQAKMSSWLQSGKDPYSYSTEKVVQLTKELQVCTLAQNEGYIDLSP